MSKSHAGVNTQPRAGGIQPGGATNRAPASSTRSVIAAVAAAAIFGAADQYLGSRVALGSWAPSASNMSAPWLIVAFLGGTAAWDARSAAIVGLASTLAALAGYFALTVSPLESVPVDRLTSSLAHLLMADRVTIAAAFISGPAFGVLGHDWSRRRSRLSAIALTAALLLEPLARTLARRLPGPAWLWLAEIAAGASCAAIMLHHAARSEHRIR